MNEDYLQGIAPLPAEEWLPTILADRNEFKSLGCPHGLKISSVESCPVYGGKNHAQTGCCHPLDACLLGCSRSPSSLAPGARLCEGGRGHDCPNPRARDWRYGGGRAGGPDGRDLQRKDRIGFRQGLCECSQ